MIKKIVLILFIIGLSIIFYENYYIGSSYPIKIKESNKDNIKRVLYEFINIRKIMIDKSIEKFDNFKSFNSKNDLDDYYKFGSYLYNELDRDTSTLGLYQTYLKENPNSIYLSQNDKEELMKDIEYINNKTNNFINNSKSNIYSYLYIYLQFVKDFMPYVSQELFDDYFKEMKYKLLNNIKIGNEDFPSKENIWFKLVDKKIIDETINDYYYNNFELLTNIDRIKGEYIQLVLNFIIIDELTKNNNYNNSIIKEYLGMDLTNKIKSFIYPAIENANKTEVNKDNYFIVNEKRLFDTNYKISIKYQDKFRGLIEKEYIPYSNIILSKIYNDNISINEFVLSYNELIVNNDEIKKISKLKKFKTLSEANHYILRKFSTASEFAEIIKNAVKNEDLEMIYSLFNGELDGIPRRSELKKIRFSEFFDNNWKNKVLIGEISNMGYRGFFIGNGNIRFYRKDNEKKDDIWSIKGIYGVKNDEAGNAFWDIKDKIISPKCFSFYWFSGDNYSFYSEQFFIKNFEDFKQNPGKFFGKEISSYLPISDEFHKNISLIYNLNDCLINE
jgi:hypothetical protein